MRERWNFTKTIKTEIENIDKKTLDFSILQKKELKNIKAVISKKTQLTSKKIV